MASCWFQVSVTGAKSYVAANQLRSGGRKRTERCIAKVRHLYRDLDTDCDTRLTSLRPPRHFSRRLRSSRHRPASTRSDGGLIALHSSGRKAHLNCSASPSAEIPSAPTSAGSPARRVT
jgi:hypothetical protein